MSKGYEFRIHAQPHRMKSLNHGDRPPGTSRGEKSFALTYRIKPTDDTVLARPACHTLSDGVKQLVEEFFRYSTNWATRISAANPRVELKGLALHVFHSLIGHIDNHGPATQDLAQHIQLFVVANLHKGPTLKDLATFLGYSEKYCSQLFQTHMGESFSAYVKRLRLEKASQLLDVPDTTLGEIAELLGFRDQFAFSHFFKKAVGCSPREYRKRRQRL